VKPLRVAILTSDNRDHDRDYGNPVPYFGTAPEALLQGLALVPEIEVHVVSCTKQPMRSPEKLAENIFFHSLVVPRLGWLRTGYQGCIRAVRRKLREIRPEIVHGQGTERDCAISAVLSGYPNVLTIHGNMAVIARLTKAPPFSFHWLAARLEAFALRRTNGVVCITHYTRELVGPLARRTWVLPNAVDPSFFECNPQPVLPPRLLCVANVDERKNQNALIRALDGLQSLAPFELHFLGLAHPERPYGKEFFSLIKTRPWCRYQGFANRNELKRYFADASGLVLPSLEDNCPMVVLEAMAAGVPVAAARVGGVPDLIRDGESGILFDPTNLADIADAVGKLLTAPALERAARTRTEARQRFHPRVIAEKHLAIYREVLGSGRV